MHFSVPTGQPKFGSSLAKPPGGMWLAARKPAAGWSGFRCFHEPKSVVVEMDVPNIKKVKEVLCYAIISNRCRANYHRDAHNKSWEPLICSHLDYH